MTRDVALRRIRSLWRLAASTTFEEESKQARRKAGYLMARYRITADEVEGRAPAPVEAPRPVRRRAVVYAGWSVTTNATGSYANVIFSA